MLTFDTFSDVIAGIYDASMDVERWVSTLALMGQAFDSNRAQMAFGDPSRADLSFWRMWNPANDISPSQVAKFVELSPTDPRGPPVRYKAVHCRQIVSDETLWASEIYKQVLGPFGIEYSMYVVIPVEDEFCSLSLMRPPDKAPYTETDCVDYGRFVPHVSRALTMHGTLHHIRREIAAARALMDGMPLGMMVVSKSDVLLANRAARALLDEGGAISYQLGRLRAATPTADGQLREAVHEASAGADRPIAVTLPLEDADDPIRCVVRRLNPASAGMLGMQDEATAVYLSDPRKPIETPEEILQRLFGLTTREASVLRALVRGNDVNAIAKHLAISQNTVRVHIKNIMQTTGGKRQADLVRMVLSSPAIAGGSTN